LKVSSKKPFSSLVFSEMRERLTAGNLRRTPSEWLGSFPGLKERYEPLFVSEPPDDSRILPYENFAHIPSPDKKKRLARLRQQARDLLELWQKWAKVKEPTFEEVGIMLRVPQNLAGR